MTAIGMGWERKRDVPALLQTLEGLRPTHLVVGTPLIPALLWGLLRAERVLPHSSDSFSDMSWRARVTKRGLVQILNRPASCELVGIGVDPNKVVPWGWPSHMTPTGYPEKEAPDSTKMFSLVISSHPMFAQTLRAQPGLKMFDEGNPQSLADALAMVATNPEVYRQLSAESATTWNSIQVPLKFGELLSRWISGTTDDIAALRGYAIGQMERSGQNE